MKNLLKHITKYLIAFVKIQVFVTLVSLPILVHWGIPFSMMTIIGNFIYTPILTIFLTLSSLIFFTQLCAIPNQSLISGLAITTTWWEKLLSFGDKSWLVGFSQSNQTLILLLCIIGILFFLRITFRLMSKIIIIALIVFSFSFFNKHQTTNKKTSSEFLSSFRKKLVISNTQNNNIFITDNGFFSHKRSPKKYVTFELKPYLIKKYGTTTIDNLTLTKPNLKSFQAAEELCETFTVKKVSFENCNNLSRKKSREFFAFKEKLKDSLILIEQHQT